MSLRAPASLICPSHKDAGVLQDPFSYPFHLFFPPAPASSFFVVCVGKSWNVVCCLSWE